MSQSLTIATWNVNSIKQRVDAVVGWLADSSGKAGGVDVLLMQEIKCEEAAFPHQPFKEAGYEVLVCGQKAYNGVAIASRLAMEERCRGLPELPDAMGGNESESEAAADTQARYLEVEVAGMIVACLYAPNGNPLYDDADGEGKQPAREGYSGKFGYKLRWWDRLVRRAEGLNRLGVPVVLGGDFNVIPEGRDCYDWEAWRGDALGHPETLRRWRRLVYLGYADGWRGVHPRGVGYSFWDYQGGAWQKDLGLRIDHLLVNAEAGDLMREVAIDRGPRGEAKASDHTPVVGGFNINLPA
ncbi:MAG: exodeoxyribonuclease III [Proteobacteria bacterium]|nr:exodeoxyribonuclease III [Pseudomonadota bacterium]